MKIKCILASFAIVSITLVACNNGSNSVPQTNYGSVVSIEPQNLNGVTPIPILKISPESNSFIYNAMLSVGKFGEPAEAGLPIFGKPIYAYQQVNIKNVKADFGYDVGIIDKYITDLNANYVNAYAIKYKTPGQNYDKDPVQIERTASGLIIVPKTKEIRGVVLYFHHTVFGKNQVPSCLIISSTQPDYCKHAADPNDSVGFGMFANLASIYASRGFAVVAPDYVGMGADWNNVHPYVVYPEVNALSGFNMLPALRQLLAENGISNSKTLPLMITGFSEGGGYALKASQIAQGSSANILQNNNLELKITTPQEGAYSLKDQMDFAFDNLDDGIFNCASATKDYKCGESNMITMDGTILKVSDDVANMNKWNIVNSLNALKYKPILTGYVLGSSMYHSFNNLTTAYNFAMNNQFWSQLPISGKRVNLYELFSGGGMTYTANQIQTSLVQGAMSINHYGSGVPLALSLYSGVSKVNDIPQEKLVGGKGQNNQGTIFINHGVNTSPQFIDIIDKGTTYNWKSISPINFISLKYDSAVTVVNTHQAYSCMKYGKSFAGDKNMIGSASICKTLPSSNIELTMINNSQVLNNVFSLAPGVSSIKGINGSAVSRYWSSPIIDLGAKVVNLNDLVPENMKSNMQTAGGLALPMDHADMFVVGNVAALCTFENILTTGVNNSKCSNLSE